MSNFKKKLLNILYASQLDLDIKNKKNNNYKSKPNGLNFIKLKKGKIKHNNINRAELFNDENNSIVANSIYLPIFNPNINNREKEKELLTLKIRKNNFNKAKKLNLTLLNSNIDDNKYLLERNKIINSLNSFSNTIKNKNRINIPTSDSSNFRNINIYLNTNRNDFNKNNNKKNLFNKFKLQKIEFSKKKQLFPNNFKIKKSIVKSFKKKKTNSYNKGNKNKLEAIGSNNKIKEKIKKMESEYSSNEVKKILINRPMRTLNSKYFEFNSKEFKNLSPTFRVLNNLRIKKNCQQNKITRLFSEGYKKRIEKIFNRNNSTFNKFNSKLENNSLSKSSINNIFNLSEINTNKINNSNSNDINNKTIFSTKIKLRTSNEGKNLYKEIIKFKKLNKFSAITSENQRCSKNIKNENRANYLKKTLLTSFINNINSSNKSIQFKY